MTELEQRQSELEREFSVLQSWEDRYKKIIMMGKDLPEFPEDLRKEENKVKGCQSQVWLHASIHEGKVCFVGDSDALIVKGLLAVVLKVYTKASPNEILNHPPDFVKSLGFESHLTPTRTGGLFAIIKQIFYYATAFQALQSHMRTQ